jgi:hypothetical protein
MLAAAEENEASRPVYYPTPVGCHRHPAARAALTDQAAAIPSPVHLHIDEITAPPLDAGAGDGDTVPEQVGKCARSATTCLLLDSPTVI